MSAPSPTGSAYIDALSAQKVPYTISRTADPWSLSHKSPVYFPPKMDATITGAVAIIRYET